jgi:hypothetical protein
MILLISTIILIALGIVAILDYKKQNWFEANEFQCVAGMMEAVVGTLFLLMELLIIGVKPLDYKNFKIKYETITETITSSEDIRDTNYTMKIIEINEEIKRNREYVDSPWIGIFYNKDIANMELLEKE